MGEKGVGDMLKLLKLLVILCGVACVMPPAPARSAITYDPRGMIILTGPDYVRWRSGVRVVVRVGQEVDYAAPGYPMRDRCAFQISGGGSGSGDDQRNQRAVVLARLDWCNPAAGPHWEDNGVTDCSGGDVGQTGGMPPPAAGCTAGNIGQIAVCWDGNRYRNTFGEANGAPPYPWCTYKSVRSCTGGHNLGQSYVCKP
jgi:hypothetical protein